MSEYQREKGKIKLLAKGNLEWICRAEWMIRKGTPMDEDDIDPIGTFTDEFYEDYFIHEADKALYRFIETEVTGEGEYSSLIPLGNNEYSFDAYFYNGGTCIEEILDNELNKLR